ncbi:MAG TPA: hypothetical protein VFF87_11335 [Hyphomicrobium sp.]|nr:hypothetical protein [Hyphomicrobium sp.]
MNACPEANRARLHRHLVFGYAAYQSRSALGGMLAHFLDNFAPKA